ncbi:hypothetical protein BV25DRAFT_1827268 [Artomyces pyxidatus]|uniref:Uncharacterized protein n=1 Tax=Artomyces pyxidatus TaxID=48021 RepID=A0ACB8SXV0_9AGAM|nr:hypothetical protein BV25DRAFT_1827268 [Artomyces pyxidatus]
MFSCHHPPHSKATPSLQILPFYHARRSSHWHPIYCDLADHTRSFGTTMTDTTTPPSSPFISDASTPTASPPLAQLSASLSSIAEQLVSASRAISQSHRAGTLDAEDTAARLDRIEREQAALRAQLAIQVVPVTPEARVEQLEHRLQEALDIIKLECVRPADPCAHQLTVGAGVQPGPPVRAPAQRARDGVEDGDHAAADGEREAAAELPGDEGRVRACDQCVVLRLRVVVRALMCGRWCAEERYEGLLKAYGLPVKGDTNAKREAVRVFIGLPV